MEKKETSEDILIAHFQGRGIELERDEDLFMSGQIDSIGMMQTIAFIEAAFKVSIPPQDLVPANFRTIEVMARYLDGKLPS